MLPHVHAVEFLGEPQYPNPEDPETPQQVYDALLPYVSTRLPTSVTLSDESTWRHYAGLSDYPHYDSYRVVAPHVDAWSKYDRWEGQRIHWGSPLEVIGDLTRSLRDLSRPKPTAYWSQGPHEGWDGFDGRRRGSPTADELRLQAYHALAARITSLYWFNLSPKSLVRYRDTLDAMARIGREIKLLEPFYLEGDAFQYQTDGAWDCSSIVAPEGALLFALDLQYGIAAKEPVFEFGPPRAGEFAFDLPAFLRQPAAVFRVDADGTHDVSWLATQRGVVLQDQLCKVGIYVATRDRELRTRLEQRRGELVDYEESLGFNPAAIDDDFEQLSAMLNDEE